MKGEIAQGTLIGGKYRIARALGGGGMGNVYLATHVALGTQVALKMLRRDANDDEVRARFQREGVLAAQLDSDHVVRVTDLGWADPKTPYLVMELLEGRDLQDELDQRGSLPVAEAVDLMLQAIAGVGAAHAAGLVHRDLKPANFYLARRKGRAPVLKVLDFGLSKALHQGALDSLTHETARFGTPVYMSPEQIRSSKNVDARADQYALAAVLYQSITGHLPFESASLTELFILVSTADPRPPSSFVPAIPAKLEKAILRGLQREPERRHHDVLAFATAITPFGSARAAALLDEVRAAMDPPSQLSAIESAETEDSGTQHAVRSASDAMATPPMDRKGAARPGVYGAEDQAKTLLRAPQKRPRVREGAVAGADDSQVGLTSSMNAASQTRRRFAVASVAGALLVLVIWFAARAFFSGSSQSATAIDAAPLDPERRRATSAAASAAPVESPAAISAQPEAPVGTAAAPVAPLVEPAPIATPSAIRSAIPSTPPAPQTTAESRHVEKAAPNRPTSPKPTARPGKPGEKSVLDVFGER